MESFRCANQRGEFLLGKVTVLIATLGLVGCGGAESTVSGTVTLDGNPVDQGEVTFYPAHSGQGQAASGSITTGGAYSVQAAQTSGLSAGEYLVRVVARGESAPHAQGGPPTPGKMLLPARYKDAGTSGLQFEVQPGSNEINLELKTTE